MALAALATLLGATLQSATGFGFALILGPALFAVFDPTEAISTLLILGAVLSVLILFGERRDREIRAADLRLVLFASVPGLIAGVFVLAVLAKSPLQVAVGVAVLCAVALQVRHDPAPATAGSVSFPLRGGTGLLVGLLTTTTSTNGPPLVLLFQRLGYTPAQQRDTLAAAFLFLDVLGVLAFVPLLANGEGLPLASIAVLVVLTVAGQVLGRRLFLRLDPAAFRTAGLILVTLAGIASVVAGFAG